MNCWICAEEIPQYDEIINNYKIPISMGFYEATEYQYIPLCIQCRKNLEKMRDKTTYRYCKMMKAKFKMFSILRDWNRKDD